MSNFRTFLITILGLLGLAISACSSVHSPANPIISDSAVKSQKSQSSESMQAWSLSGSISIVQPQHSTIATLSWTQYNPNTYNLLLYGPLSLGQIQIQGQPGMVTLQQSGHPTVTASNAEALILKQLGWTLPVSNLYYWVRGLPAPGAVRDLQKDASQRLVGFSQQGWEIQYLGFQTVNGMALPTKIVATYPNLRLTLAIKRWVTVTD